MAYKANKPESIAWEQNILAAEEHYKLWSTKYKCNSLENLYQGKHYKNTTDNYEGYTLNLVYATIKLKLSSLLLHNPSFKLSPRPSRMDFHPETAIRVAI
jgi:hypothetical protein